MISQQQIAAWRSQAPWSDDLMVEQDYLLTQAVAAIFTDPKLKIQLAMRRSLKVEVNLNERKPLFELTTVHIDVPDEDGMLRKLPVVSYDLDEMLGTKMRALIQRDHGRRDIRPEARA